MPTLTNSINHYGIGAARITNYITVYEKPDLNSKVKTRIYWNNIGHFIVENEKTRTQMIFSLFTFQKKISHF